MLAYWPNNILPKDAQIERNRLTEECYAQIPGPILSTRIGYVSHKLGIKPTATEPAIADVFRTEDNETNTALMNEFRERVDAQYYDAAFLGIQMHVALKDILEENYVYAGTNFDRKGSGGGYQLSSVWLSKNFIGDRVLVDIPVCEADSIFVESIDPAAVYTRR